MKDEKQSALSINFKDRHMEKPRPNDDLKARAKRFSIDIFRFYDLLPKTEQSGIIGKQLTRCASSVGANTRSAFRGRSTKEFTAKLGIVVEEADESCFWLEVIEELALVKDNNKVKDLLKEAEELTAIFNSIKYKYKK